MLGKSIGQKGLNKNKSRELTCASNCATLILSPPAWFCVALAGGCVFVCAGATGLLCVVVVLLEAVTEMEQ